MAGLPFISSLTSLKQKDLSMILSFLVVSFALYKVYEFSTQSSFEDKADAVFGVAKKFKTKDEWKDMSADDCRNIAEESDGKYVAWGHHNEDHEDDDLKNSCYMYTKLKPFKGDDDNEVSMMSCADASLSVLDGCKPAKVGDDDSEDESEDEDDGEDDGTDKLDDLLEGL